MSKKQQADFFETHRRHRYCSGGVLRRTRRGRRQRPLSTKDSVHAIFKAKASGFRQPRVYRIVNEVMARYAKRFHVKVESASIQNDHIHLSIRAPSRSCYQSFLRVVAGQIAQRLKKTALWKERPYTRVIIGRRAWAIVQDYIRLNEKEAAGEIPYSESRLRGLRPEEWAQLWT